MLIQPIYNPSPKHNRTHLRIYITTTDHLLHPERSRSLHPQGSGLGTEIAKGITIPTVSERGAFLFVRLEVVLGSVWTVSWNRMLCMMMPFWWQWSWWSSCVDHINVDDSWVANKIAFYPNMQVVLFLPGVGLSLALEGIDVGLSLSFVKVFKVGKKQESPLLVCSCSIFVGYGSIHPSIHTYTCKNNPCSPKVMMEPHLIVAWYCHFFFASFILPWFLFFPCNSSTKHLHVPVDSCGMLVTVVLEARQNYVKRQTRDFPL